jgi:transposase
MSKSNLFSPEVRERVVQERRGNHPSLWAAIESITP